MSEAPEVAAPVVPEGPPDVPKSKEDVSQQSEEPSEEIGESEATGEPDSQDVDAELEEMKKRLAQMEAESAGLKDGAADASQEQSGPGTNGLPTTNGEGQAPVPAPAQPNATPGGPAHLSLSPDSVADADARSIYVGNVDYSATGDQLSAHFSDCGTINRVTIVCNKATGQPKGYAYIEFQDHLAAQNALILNESSFLGRPLKIFAKRTNIPAAHRGFGRGRGRYTRGGRGVSRRPRRSWRGRWAPY